MQVSKWFPSKCLMVASVGLVVLAGAPNSRAQSDEVAGQYVCSEAHVAGKPSALHRAAALAEE